MAGLKITLYGLLKTISCMADLVSGVLAIKAFLLLYCSRIYCFVIVFSHLLVLCPV